MTDDQEYFARTDGRINASLLRGKLAVVVGIGTVGSKMAYQLANSRVRYLRLIDGKALQLNNVGRHALSRRYVGMNKAEGMTLDLADEVPGVRPEAVPRDVDASMSDAQLDGLLEDADLIIAATDDREAQRRIGRRALALDIPAVFPALYAQGGGEVFVQRNSRFPCFLCWDDHRPTDQQLRGVSALDAETLALIGLAVHLSLGVLDGSSEHARLLAARPPNPNPPQLFVQNRFALGRPRVTKRSDCLSCAVGPARPENVSWQPLPPLPDSLWQPPPPLSTPPQPARGSTSQAGGTPPFVQPASSPAQREWVGGTALLIGTALCLGLPFLIVEATGAADDKHSNLLAAVVLLGSFALFCLGAVLAIGCCVAMFSDD